MELLVKEEEGYSTVHTLAEFLIRFVNVKYIAYSNDV